MLKSKSDTTLSIKKPFVIPNFYGWKFSWRYPFGLIDYLSPADSFCVLYKSKSLLETKNSGIQNSKKSTTEVYFHTQRGVRFWFLLLFGKLIELNVQSCSPMAVEGTLIPCYVLIFMNKRAFQSYFFILCFDCFFFQAAFCVWVPCSVHYLLSTSWTRLVGRPPC